MDIPPLKIVGYEGLFGSVAMIFVMLPIVQHLPGPEGGGIHEDSKDTWHMITHTPSIATVIGLDAIALLAYNVSGMCVTGHLGAVFRTVLETTRYIILETHVLVYAYVFLIIHIYIIDIYFVFLFFICFEQDALCMARGLAAVLYSSWFRSTRRRMDMAFLDTSRR